MSSLALGIDFGKTHIRIGAVDEAGRVIYYEEVSSRGFQQSSDIGDAMASLAQNALLATEGEVREVLGIGVGSTGAVDVERGIVLTSGSLPYLRDYPLASDLRERLGIPVVLTNDTCAAALGEAWSLGGSPPRSLVYTGFGTGVGVANVRDGRIESGAHGTLGLISGLRLHLEGPTINELCGGKGLVARLSKIVGREVDPESDLAEMAYEHSRESKRAYEEAVEAAALLLAFASTLHDPDVLVAGGGLWLGQPSFRVAVREALKGLFGNAATGVNSIALADSKMGQRAGVFGAAQLLRQYIRDSA